eukprot:TRINITY_DN2078_c0_g1_i1.p1 TRINITY_DN2078_c0_g1~~TRINITY_DN2078_c0_g1_i1.p1  ORF type:complete len:331 (+),score=22.02 TRINITY_DN2078_c0_g1_i1:42-1034(+)
MVQIVSVVILVFSAVVCKQETIAKQKQCTKNDNINLGGFGRQILQLKADFQYEALDAILMSQQQDSSSQGFINTNFEQPNGYSVYIPQDDPIIPDEPNFPSIIFEAVQGIDNRVRVPNTGIEPFSAVGQIGLVKGRCTGTLIGPRFVLTAAHCIINVRSGKFLDDLDFYPGRDHVVWPFGHHEWEFAFVNDQYFQNQSTTNDFGLIVLKQPVENVQPINVNHQCGQQLEYSLNIVGYPFDRNPSDAQWATGCQNVVLNCSKLTINHGCDTEAGMSGAPMFIFRRNQNPRFSIRAIHTASIDRQDQPINLGIIITEKVLEQLNQWMSVFQE